MIIDISGLLLTGFIVIIAVFTFTMNAPIWFLFSTNKLHKIRELKLILQGCELNGRESER